MPSARGANARAPAAAAVLPGVGATTASDGSRSQGTARRRVRHSVPSVETTEVRLETGSRLVTDLSPAIGSFCAGKGDGLLNVFAPHATAGIALIELGSGTEDDLEEVLARVLPRDDRYRHRHGSRGHGGDHVLPALVAPTLTLPVVGGRPALGTWQSVVLVDPNVDNPTRTIRLSFLPG